MTKKFLTFAVLTVVLMGILVPVYSVKAETYNENCLRVYGSLTDYCKKIAADPAKGDNPMPNSLTPEQIAAQKKAEQQNKPPSATGILSDLIKPLFQTVSLALITISSLVLLLSGWIFDEVVKFTIVEMAKNLSGGSGGVGDAITNAWSVLRDIANMCFIFVLLYAAFKAMFDTNFGGFGKTVKDIIIVALLINFSLFFSKVVIDASNIVSVGFYNSITNNTVTYNTDTTKGSSFEKTISAGYMNMLGLQTFFGANILTNGNLSEPGQILTVGIITAVFMLITAVILLIAGIMFAARFIILIFLMILSPLALIAYIIPGQEGKFKEWKDALIAQSFFAPLYFALTWVVFKVGSSLIGVLGKKPGVEFSEITTNPQGVMPLIINYILIIGFSIAALILAKKMASSTYGFTQLTGAMGANKVAGVVGGASLGGAAALGRRTIGAGASRLSESQRFQNFASKSLIGQKALEGTRKVANSSFDVRQTKGIGGALQGTALGSFGTGKAGGFDATLKAQVAKKEKFAQTLTTDAQKEAYAKRQMSGVVSKYYTRGGSSSSKNSLFGVMGRSNRVVASKTLNNQLTPLETKEKDLQNKETQLSQQLANMTNEQATLQAAVTAGTASPQQVTRLAALNDVTTTGTPPVPSNRNSISYIQHHLGVTQTQLSNATAEVTRIRGLITSTGLTNTTPSGTITDPITGKTRQRRADEQNY